MRAGKRLPKSSEWYMLSVGTREGVDICNIETAGHTKNGEKKLCVSATGVHDAIGNVWEWTSDDVIDGMHEGRKLPVDGYVSQVDAGGMATQVASKTSDLFYSDYFWSTSEGAFGILRGGFFGSRSDAGVYAAHARTVPTSFGTAIGFRCIL